MYTQEVREQILNAPLKWVKVASILEDWDNLVFNEGSENLTEEQRNRYLWCYAGRFTRYLVAAVSAEAEIARRPFNKGAMVGTISGFILGLGFSILIFSYYLL